LTFKRGCGIIRFMNISERIVLTKEEREQIEKYARGKNFPMRLVQRARIIKMSSEGVYNHEIAKRLGLSRPTVQLWRERFLAMRLAGLEKDAPRIGRYPKLSKKKIDEIVRATLHTTPTDVAHWSVRSMAKAQGVSKDMVQRIWKQYNLKPHLINTFKLSRGKAFREKFYDIVGLYMNPPDKAIVLCVDEKSRMQALERSQLILPLRPGIPSRQTHDYVRHGTTTLFAALNMLDGNVIGDCMPKFRHQEFIRFLQIINVKTPPELDLHLIVDNYATHKHKSVIKWLERHPRFHLHLTPTSSSWLNHAERWFSEITCKIIRRGSFENIKELVNVINQYIDNHNQNPKVFVWTASAESILNKISNVKNC
jgi:transposase